MGWHIATIVLIGWTWWRIGDLITITKIIAENQMKIGEAIGAASYGKRVDVSVETGEGE
jgi:hypothetical protein